jgi:hypothetical protein
MNCTALSRQAHYTEIWCAKYIIALLNY